VELTVSPGSLAICRLAPDATVPEWLGQGEFVSLTRTPEELSIVCPQAWVPQGVECQRGWTALKVHGPLDFSLTGILASLAAALGKAGVSLFAVSTYDTDYLLVRSEQIEAARGALRAAGHTLAD
jgi:uncharacterized protein